VESGKVTPFELLASRDDAELESVKLNHARTRRSSLATSPRSRSSRATTKRWRSRCMRGLSTKDREILRREFKAASTTVAKESILKSYK
jgi:hypothetical protein